MTKLPKKMKEHLCVPSLLNVTRRGFSKVSDPVKQRSEISLVDCLMSGVALFGLKFASLLQFDKARFEDEIIRHNLRTLYGIEKAPCDTYFRERLDEVSPDKLQRIMNRIIALIQRSKLLEGYRYLENYYFVPIDGTGYFSSHEVHCESCCVKHHRDGTVTFYHQMLSAVLAHPEIKTVLPLALEPITKSDGSRKNDCEHSAAKRLLQSLRKSHPHLKIVVVLDALYADGVMIKLLKELNLRFIITAKDSDLDYLFEFYRAVKHQRIEKVQEGVQKHYEWAKALPLNDSHSDSEVNVFEYQEIGKKGDKKYFCWLTDLEVNEKTIEQLVKGGRARWRVENETFNTLKNQGYQFEHNFGHGNKQLSTVLAYLMFIAFLIDQTQEFACQYFKAILAKWGGRLYVWQKMRHLFFGYFIDTWDHFYDALVGKHRKPHLLEILDTS
jgi:hypothetical protein